MIQNRFVFLDGIRGIAAILVAIYHMAALWKIAVPHGYLAVDLFFVLSGFVIAHAYDEKLVKKEVSAFAFIRFRILRLYPIYFLSILVCLPLLFSGDLMGVPSSLSSRSILSAATLILCTTLFLPFYREGVFALFPLNQPYWSLFFELLTNFIYSAIRPILSVKVLFLISTISAVGLFFVVRYFGSLNVGSSWAAIGIIGGFIRSIFGVFTGLLIHRIQLQINVPKCLYRFPWIYFFVVILVLFFPILEGYNECFEILIVCLIFPLSILFASKSYFSRFSKALSVLGKSSYPLYVLHFPASQMLVRWSSVSDSSFSPLAGFGLLLILTVIGFWLDKVYDLSVRRWLLRITNKKFVLKTTTKVIEA